MEEALLVEDTDELSASDGQAVSITDQTTMPGDKLATLYLDDGESIISLLECPVCLDVMKPPILQCENGHSVCTRCKPSVNHCPTCRGPFIETKNLLAETLANKVRYPCNNHEAGCPEKVRLEDMATHDVLCPYRSYTCLPGESDGCDWKGRRWEIQQHVLKKHYKFFFEGDCGNFTTSVSNWDKNNEFTFLFSSCGELFWYRSKFDPDKQRLFRALQYIGLKENASKYRYEHQLFNNEQEISIVNVTKSDSENVQSIFDSLQCFVLDFDILKLYVTNSTKLKHRMTISQIKSHI